MPPLIVDGESNESLVLDGEWFEKQRGGEPKTRLPAASFRSVEWKEAEKRPQLEAIVAGLESASSAA